MPGMGRHLIPVYIAVLALAIIWITPASCKADGGRPGRDSTNWYAYPFIDRQGQDSWPHKMFRLLRSNNMRFPDLGPSGQSYHSFRNPVLINTASGRVIAFVQGHKYDSRECGHVTIVLRRPKEKRFRHLRYDLVYRDWWQAVQEPFEGYEGTWTNPTPVVDGDTLYLFANWNRLDYSRDGNETLPDTGQVTKKIDSTPEGRRRLYLSKSLDDGKTWYPPVDMTEQLTPKGWSWDVVGRGRGIKVRSGELIVPAMGRNLIGRGPRGNRTWEYQLLEGAGEEGTIVQTSNDQLLRSDCANPGDGFRRVSRGSIDYGFEPFKLDKNMPDPGRGASGSLILFTYRNWTIAWPYHNRILFINSASSTNIDEHRIQLSYYHDGSHFSIWRDLGDNWVFTEWDCRRIVGREGGRISMTYVPGITTEYIAIASELSFGENGGSKDDHYAILFRHMHISWMMRGHIRGTMNPGPEEKDPALRIDPDGLRDYPDPEDDPRPYASPCPRDFNQIYRWGHMDEYGGSDPGKNHRWKAGEEDYQFWLGKKPEKKPENE